MTSPSPLWTAAKALADGESGFQVWAMMLMQGGAVIDAWHETNGTRTSALWWFTVAACKKRQGSWDVFHSAASRAEDIDEGEVGTRGVALSPLWYAAKAMSEGCESGADACRLLLARGASPDTVGWDGQHVRSSALWYATLACCKGVRGAGAIMQLLLDNGAEVETGAVGDVKMFTPLVTGTRQQNWGCGEEFNETDYTCTPLCGAAFALNRGWGSVHGIIVAMDILLQSGADARCEAKAPIRQFASLGCIDDIDALGTPLAWITHVAGKEGTLAAAQLLMDHGAQAETCTKVHVDGGVVTHSALSVAIRSAYMSRRKEGVQLVRMLLEHGADVEDDRWDGHRYKCTSLWWVVHRASKDGVHIGVDIARLLLLHGADVQSIGLDMDNGMQCPVLWCAVLAACNESEIAVHLATTLLYYGATPDVCSNDWTGVVSNTALWLTVMVGTEKSKRVMRELVRSGADLLAVSREAYNYIPVIDVALQKDDRAHIHDMLRSIPQPILRQRVGGKAHQAHMRRLLLGVR